MTNYANVSCTRTPRIATNVSIDSSAIVGGGTVIWAFANVMRDVVIGQDCSIGHCAEIGRGSKIGHDTRISHGVFLPPNSIIGNGVFLGPSCIFTDDKFPRAGNADYHAQPPIVEDGASVGAGAVILPGVRIGAGATVGAGAIVTKSVPAGAIVRCEPARERASQRNGIGETLPQ